MKYVSITFDDGRADNYEIAYPIMAKNGFSGTIYCTTGYIDGTWKKPEDWKSTEIAITVDGLKKIRNAGWELGLHGDKHTTEVNDMRIALKKFREWGIDSSPVGFSMPNSRIDGERLNSFISTYYGKEVLYIRKGRKNNTRSLSSRIMFACYSYLGIQTAYNIFNKHNVIDPQNIDPKNIFSVVIRNNDKPQMIVKFLKQLPDETWTVLMLHSILPQTNHLYGTDPWNWSRDRFEVLCWELKRLVDDKRIEIRTVADMVCSFDASEGYA